MFSLFVLMFSVGFAYAQNTVKGRVKSVSGEGLPGVNIQVKGTTEGSASDFEGNFELMASPGDVLVFSFVGFTTKELIVDGNFMEVALSEDAESLDEVVVTALGIKREAKALGYALTEVGGDELTQVKSTNAMNALQGRVAGVNVSTSSTGASGSSRVIIRGASSMTGNNQPLYVVDGIPVINTTKGSVGKFDGEFGDGGDDISGINPDDIESVTVLKGSSAGALYGAQAGNGVIMITTKNGRNQQGFGVEFSSSFTFDKVNTDLQDFQTTYGQGTFGLKPGFIIESETGNIINLDDGTEEGLIDATANALSSTVMSYGPKLDGSSVVGWDGIYRPYAYAGNNVDRFYQTGSTAVNSIALTNGGEKGSYRLSATNLNNKDVFPGSSLKRQSFSFNGTAEINPKLSSTVNAKYIIEKVHNRVGIGDGPGNANFSTLMLANNINVEEFDPWKNPDGTELKFNASRFLTNPYWVTNEFKNDDHKNRLIASTTLRYDLTDWLYINGRAGIDSYDLSRTRITPWGTAFRTGGRLYQAKSTFTSFDSDIMLGIDKDLTEKISTHIILGGNTHKDTFEQLSAQGDEFQIVGLEDLNNTFQPIPVNSFSESKTNSLYGSLEFSYDSAFYLTLTGRNQWFSTLSYPGKTTPNDDFYPSISASWLINETFDLGDQVNYAKIRSSFAQVAGATSPYSLNLDYVILGSFLGQSFGQINGSTIPNPNLVPLEKNEFEVGFDGRFFANRFNIDIAYYQNTTTNDIVRASATGTSGFTRALLNVGELENKGVELLIGGSPVRNDDFSWNISYNMGYNDSEIISTNDEGNPVTIQESRTSTAWIEHVVGERYGTIVGDAYLRDGAGNIVYEIGASGIPRPVKGERKVLGEGVAPLTMGLSNTFTFKNVSLSFLIDGKFGGQVFSGTNAQAYANGKHKATLEGRENGLEVNGVVQNGEDAAGNPVYESFTTVVEPKNVGSYYQSIAGDGNGTGIAEEFVYDSDFIKFRELSISYSLPSKFLGDQMIKDLRLALIGRNLFYISKDVENIDPEASINNTNAQGLERFGVPAARSIGFSVNVKF